MSFVFTAGNPGEDFLGMVACGEVTYGFDALAGNVAEEMLWDRRRDIGQIIVVVMFNVNRWRFLCRRSPKTIAKHVPPPSSRIAH
jgi:hypothetical protein